MEQDFAKRALGTEIIKWRLKVNKSTYREFWIRTPDGHFQYGTVTENYPNFLDSIHVIEIAAVEQLKAERDRFEKDFRNNYKWRIEQANEITALKINLENEKSIGQERLSIANSLLSKHAALKSKLKIAVEALNAHHNACSCCDIDYENHELCQKALSEIGGEV